MLGKSTVFLWKSPFLCVFNVLCQIIHRAKGPGKSFELCFGILVLAQSSEKTNEYRFLPVIEVTYVRKISTHVGAMLIYIIFRVFKNVTFWRWHLFHSDQHSLWISRIEGSIPCYPKVVRELSVPRSFLFIANIKLNYKKKYLTEHECDISLIPFFFSNLLLLPPFPPPPPPLRRLTAMTPPLLQNLTVYLSTSKGSANLSRSSC